MATTIRPFGGTLAEAEGILAVERATFNESPYQAAEIQALLTGGPQHAWLAVQGGTAGDRVLDAGTRGSCSGQGENVQDGNSIVGFVIAFPTCGERQWWEIDLLAVHPRWTGQGLANQLIEAAAAHGPSHARQARAVVATDNGASARAFSRSGFRRAPQAHKLLIYRPKGLAPRPTHGSTVTVRQVRGKAQQAAGAGGSGGWRAAPLLESHRRSGAETSGQLQVETPAPGELCSTATLLLAEEAGRPVGHAELVEVQTLLYRGIWIESLVAESQAARAALVRESVEQVKSQGLDELGAMVPERDWPLQEALVAAGFRSLGEFQWFTADLPL